MSGERGILGRRFSHLFRDTAVALQHVWWPDVASSRLMPVVPGCLESFGIVFSTVSAQSQNDSVGTDAPGAIASHRRSRRRKRSLRRSSVDHSPQNRAASYARFSSDHQRDESISDQQRRCREAADANGHAILPDLEFSDERISGTKRNRAGLNGMLAAAEGGEFQILYIFSLSRFARESIITMPLLKKLVHVHRVRFVSTTEGIDSDRDGWEFIASFMSLVHESYIRELSQNVLRGQEGALLEGYSVGDWCFGYGSEPVSGTESTRRGRDQKPRMRYVVDPETAAWVRRIFQWFVRENRSIGWIVRNLNAGNAPKDHRSCSEDWHHHTVIRLLSREKYVGIWPWGEMKNVRDPETGDVHQELRPDAENAKWTRNLPQLRIIDDDVFELAQKRLEQNTRIWGRHRGQDGRLRGSSSGAKFGHPTRLTSGLLECRECGRRLVCTRSNGAMHCPSYQIGRCSCKTQLPRPLAERMILGAIGERILGNREWFESVFQALREAWAEYCNTVPVALEAVQKQLAELERKVARLIDRIEEGDESLDVKTRLDQRRSEQDQLRTRLKKLTAEQTSHPVEPTREWLQQKLADLGQALRKGTPAAAEALRELVGGRIVVERLPRPGTKRFFWRGKFSISVESICRTIGAPAEDDSSKTVPQNAENEQIILDFIEPDPSDELSDAARELYDAGWMNTEIANKLNVSRNRVAKLVQRSFAKEGQEMPDGRLRRSQLARKSIEPLLHQKLAEPVKELWDQDLPLQDIAQTLGIDRNTVTKAVRFWHESRGLEVPDGRTRRKQTRLKKQKSS